MYIMVKFVFDVNFMSEGETESELVKFVVCCVLAFVFVTTFGEA